MRGTIKKLVADKGFGFIKPDNGGQDVFVHINDMQEGYDFNALQEGSVVEYSIGAGRDGREKAVNVVIVDGPAEEDMEMAA